MAQGPHQNGRNKHTVPKPPPWRQVGRLASDARSTETQRPLPGPPAPTPPNEHAIAAATTARRMLDAKLGLIDGARQLHEQLTKLGEFAGGEFSGEFAPLTFFCFDTDPYPSESQRATSSPAVLEEADRWLPTLLGRHRAAVLKACERVVEKYA